MKVKMACLYRRTPDLVAEVGFEPTSLAYEASVCTALLPRIAVSALAALTLTSLPHLSP